MMLELYTHPMSPCAQKVRITLAEKGLPWKAHHVSLEDKENLRPEYLRLNPLGVVPTLVHDGRPVIESSVICEFLDDLAPEPPLRPADPYRRAQMRLWMKHVDNRLHPACGALQWTLAMRPRLMELPEAEREALIDRVPEKPRRERQRRLLRQGLDAPDVAEAVQTYRATIERLEDDLERQAWAAGEEFSLADVALAPYFQTLYHFGWQAFYADCPRVGDWYERCRARPSYQQGVSADFPPERLASLRAAGEAAWPRLAACLAA